MMSSIAQLTEEQFIQLLDDYFAQPAKRHKMTVEEIKEVAKLLNKKLNVPIITETKEEKILIKIVIKVDTFLYDNLPNEFYDLARSLPQGIDDDEAKRLIRRLSKLANDKVNIPYLPDPMEYIAIRFIIAIIVNAARKNWDIPKAQTEVDKLQIPNAANPSDADLDKLLA